MARRRRPVEDDEDDDTPRRRRRGRDDDDEDDDDLDAGPPKPPSANNAWTGLLGITAVALVGAAGMYALDAGEYEPKPSPPGVNLPALKGAADPAGGAGTTG